MGERNSDPPGAVSDQNMEEAESPLRDDERHPEPRTEDRDAARSPGAGDENDRDEGSSKEGSQATGHPQNAG